MEIRDQILTARLTPLELKELQRLANEADRSRSDYVRGIIKAIVNNKELRVSVEKARRGSYDRS